MEADTMIQGQALGQCPSSPVQEREEELYEQVGVKIMMGKPVMSPNLSLCKLMDSEWKAKELAGK